MFIKNRIHEVASVLQDFPLTSTIAQYVRVKLAADVWLACQSDRRNVTWWQSARWWRCASFTCSPLNELSSWHHVKPVPPPFELTVFQVPRRVSNTFPDTADRRGAHVPCQASCFEELLRSDANTGRFQNL